MNELCRLCLKRERLIWIFDAKLSDLNMKQIIQITTGVEIKLTDKVSQNVCESCCQVTIRMFKFRNTAIKNDTALKDKFQQMTNCASNSSTTHNNVKLFKSHESVNKLIKQYPSIKIPRSILENNLDPSIVLDKNDVSRWFEENEKKKLSIASVVEKNDVGKHQEKIIPKWGNPKENSKTDSSNENSHIDLKNKQIGIVSNKSTYVIVDSQEKQAEAELQKEGSSTNLDQSDKSLSGKAAPDEILNPSPSAHKRQRSPSIQVIAKRRKIVDTMDCDQSDELLEPRKSTESELSAINKSTSVHVCGLCNAVLYSNKDIKIHNRKHSKCPFCKSRFRTIEAKDSHLEECSIRSTMQDLLIVSVKRVEQDNEIKSKYRHVFENFQSSDSNLQIGPKQKITKDCNSEEGLKIDCDKTDEKNQNQEQNKKCESSQSNDCGDIYCISDDEMIEDKTSNSSSNLNCGALLIPEFKISKSDELFNKLDFEANEGDVIKTLLNSSNNIPQEIPSNESIKAVCLPEKMYTFEKLMLHLEKYKIPFVVTYGIKMDVSFEKNEVDSKKIKNKDPWNPEDCIAVDDVTNTLNTSILAEMLNNSSAPVTNKPSFETLFENMSNPKPFEPCKNVKNVGKAVCNTSDASNNVKQQSSASTTVSKPTTTVTRQDTGTRQTSVSNQATVNSRTPVSNQVKANRGPFSSQPTVINRAPVRNQANVNNRVTVSNQANVNQTNVNNRAIISNRATVSRAPVSNQASVNRTIVNNQATLCNKSVVNNQSAVNTQTAANNQSANNNQSAANKQSAVNKQSNNNNQSAANKQSAVNKRSNINNQAGINNRASTSNLVSINNQATVINQSTDNNQATVNHQATVSQTSQMGHLLSNKSAPQTFPFTNFQSTQSLPEYAGYQQIYQNTVLQPVSQAAVLQSYLQNTVQSTAVLLPAPQSEVHQQVSAVPVFQSVSQPSSQAAVFRQQTQNLQQTQSSSQALQARRSILRVNQPPSFQPVQTQPPTGSYPVSSSMNSNFVQHNNAPMVSSSATALDNNSDRPFLRVKSAWQLLERQDSNFR